jgi:hypothetical protein
VLSEDEEEKDRDKEEKEEVQARSSVKGSDKGGQVESKRVDRGQYDTVYVDEKRIILTFHNFLQAYTHTNTHNYTSLTTLLTYLSSQPL